VYNETYLRRSYVFPVAYDPQSDRQLLRRPFCGGRIRQDDRLDQDTEAEQLRR
jgi:hypothetical protein